MALELSEKAKIIEGFQRHKSDTASPEVQIALMTKRIQGLTDHFRSNKKDHHSRRGLMKIVGRRRRLLDYLRKQEPNSYRKLIADLGLRK